MSPTRRRFSAYRKILLKEKRTKKPSASQQQETTMVNTPEFFRIYKRQITGTKKAPCGAFFANPVLFAARDVETR
ncbi:hypothetical protein ACLK1T_10875 [Escherichia coli]